MSLLAALYVKREHITEICLRLLFPAVFYMYREILLFMGGVVITVYKKEIYSCFLKFYGLDLFVNVTFDGKKHRFVFASDCVSG